MTRVPFKINIEGRVKKIRTTDPLVPLYEAISNSIHAIESSATGSGNAVRILGEPEQRGLLPRSAIEEDEPGITGFEITDDG